MNFDHLTVSNLQYSLEEAYEKFIEYGAKYSSTIHVPDEENGIMRTYHLGRDREGNLFIFMGK